MKNYYYSILDEEGKKLYDAILVAIQTGKDSGGTLASMEKDKLKSVFGAVMSDNPEIFYINTSHMGYNQTPARVHFDYLYSDNDIANKQLEIKLEVDSIINNIRNSPSTKTPQMMCLYLHNYLMRTITYDNTAAEGEYKDAPEAYSIYGALVKKKAVCQGISLAYKLICDRLGIPCAVVTGYILASDGTKHPHAWNMVHIEGKYAHIDVTWDISLSLTSDYKRFDYFLISDEEILVNRIIDNPVPKSGNTAPLDYFHSTGRFFTNKTDLRNYIDAETKKKPDYICFKLEKSRYLTDSVIDGILEKVDSSIAGMLSTGGQYYTLHNRNQLVFFYGIEYPHH